MYQSGRLLNALCTTAIVYVRSPHCSLDAAALFRVVLTPPPPESLVCFSFSLFDTLRSTSFVLSPCVCASRRALTFVRRHRRAVPIQAEKPDIFTSFCCQLDEISRIGSLERRRTSAVRRADSRVRVVQPWRLPFGRWAGVPFARGCTYSSVLKLRHRWTLLGRARAHKKVRAKSFEPCPQGMNPFALWHGAIVHRLGKIERERSQALCCSTQFLWRTRWRDGE